MTDVEQNTTPSKRVWTFPQIQWITASTGLSVIGLALLYKLVTGPGATNPADLIAISVLGILFALSPSFDSIKTISFDKGKLQVELDRIQERVSQNEKAIADLIIMSMGEGAYKNLKKISDGTFTTYKKYHHHGLERELYHLWNLGYIRLKDGTANSIFEIPEEGPNLLQYIEVMNLGKRYIKLREERTRE
jgi:hypothetical protein